MSDGNDVKWMQANCPVEFGISTEGELLISWPHPFVVPGPGGQTLENELWLGVRIPASELPKLKLGLELSREIQEVLAATPPTQSKH